MSESTNIELSLLDQVPLAVVIATTDGKIVYSNRGAEMLCGWTKEDVIHRPIEALAASHPAEEALVDALESVTSGGVWAGRVSLRHRSGEARAADVRGAPLQNAEEATIGVMLVAVEAPPTAGGDAEERVRVGRRIARARKEAGLTQKQLADRIGVARRSVQGYESGSVAPYRQLQHLAEALGQSRQSLVAEHPPPAAMPPELKAELRGLVRDELRDALRELDASAVG